MASRRSTRRWRLIWWTPPPGSTTRPGCPCPITTRSCPSLPTLQPDAFSAGGDVVLAQTALLSYTAAVSALYETSAPPQLRDMQLEELGLSGELFCAGWLWIWRSLASW